MLHVNMERFVSFLTEGFESTFFLPPLDAITVCANTHPHAHYSFTLVLGCYFASCDKMSLSHSAVCKEMDCAIEGNDPAGRLRC